MLEDHEAQAEEKRWEALRRMAQQEKLEIILMINSFAREWKAAGFRLSHPGLSSEEIQRMVRESFLYARD